MRTRRKCRRVEGGKGTGDEGIGSGNLKSQSSDIRPTQEGERIEMSKLLDIGEVSCILDTVSCMLDMSFREKQTDWRSI